MASGYFLGTVSSVAIAKGSKRLTRYHHWRLPGFNECDRSSEMISIGCFQNAGVDPDVFYSRINEFAALPSQQC